MFSLFKGIEDVFIVLGTNLTLEWLLYIFGGFFVFTVIMVLILTSRAYEARLIKAIDLFNNYFIEHSQINEENLVAFNNRMKSKKVPKQLRKQWQQFVLYRENKASYYMSFDTCVANPIKNSSFRVNINIMNIVAYITASLSFVLGLYVLTYTGSAYLAYEAIAIASIIPAVILLVNFLMTIFLNLRHNAIVSDLYQNYQYFEVNIDKATQTLPDYVDYEVLFDRNEIKKGIPILYAYLQKRAEEEQRELERARLKNVEHEKFNFDESGVEGSLVLERAMQEAENYIAERKKYNQDTEQINSDITQEDMNFREITKEYNRQMQVSKESFANYKSQLEEASSSIEANYLKKQQQQELDRQRNLEKEYDAASERHKKVVASYQSELDSVDKFRAESRKNLETAMMSEFSSYSSKVYDEAKKVAEERQQDKVAELKSNIKALEENLLLKNKELEKIYTKYQELTDALEQQGTLDAVQERVNESNYASSQYEEPQDNGEQPLEFVPDYQEEPVAEESITFNYEPQEEQSNYDESINFNYEPLEESSSTEDYSDETFNYEPIEEQQEESYEFNYEPIEIEDDSNESVEEPIHFDYEPIQETSDINDEINSEFLINTEDKGEDEFFAGEYINLDDVKTQEDDDLFHEFDDDDEEDSTVEEEESNTLGENVEQKPRKKAGRPRKVVSQEDQKPKRSVGRPRKEKKEEQPKRRVGRPKKEESKTQEPKRKVGRPKKETVATEVVKRKAGRPRKEKKEEQPKRRVGRPKKEEKSTIKSVVRKAGRPRKISSKPSVDIDQYLKEIDAAIASEHAVIERARQELEKKTKIKK